jgi:hypothetical protein
MPMAGRHRRSEPNSEWWLIVKLLLEWLLGDGPGPRF